MASDYGPYPTQFSLQGVPLSNHFVTRPSTTTEDESAFWRDVAHKEISDKYSSYTDSVG
jgi:hypothetical protein